MDKIELFYFYKMYRVIMTLLQSENSAVVLKTLNDENLDIGKCYEIYHENLTKVENIKYNKL